MVMSHTTEHELGVPIPGAILPVEQWARTALRKLPASGPMDWAALFGRQAPIVLDLGCGNGRFVLGSALRRPDWDHLGLDALPLVIRYATRRANQRGLHNVRFAVAGACEFLSDFVAPHSITEIHVYHPQPYHDSTRAVRRLITPDFAALVHRSLLSHGLFVLQTDNAAYWRYMCTVMRKLFDFHEQHGPWPDSPHGRTRREIVARSKRLHVFRGWGTPRPGLTDAAIADRIRRLPPPDFDTRHRKSR